MFCRLGMTVRRPGESGVVCARDCEAIWNRPVGRKIEIGSVMQLSGKRDAALPALASPRQCHSNGPALLGRERKGLAGLLSDAGAIG